MHQTQLRRVVPLAGDPRVEVKPHFDEGKHPMTEDLSFAMSDAEPKTRYRTLTRCPSELSSK